MSARVTHYVRLKSYGLENIRCGLYRKKKINFPCGTSFALTVGN